MPARILIADDSPLILKTLARLLESQPENWTVCAEATDGPQALGKAIETKPDLIIIDFQVPRMDGLRTSSKILKILPDVPIVINTMHKSRFLDAEAEKVVVRAVVIKSDITALIKTVKDLLDECPTTSETRKK
jgi:DNA-binding NarL/FixJ family response regulator